MPVVNLACGVHAHATQGQPVLNCKRHLLEVRVHQIVGRAHDVRLNLELLANLSDVLNALVEESDLGVRSHLTLSLMDRLAQRVVF